jgi:cystathionine gamma-synthase
MKVTDWLDPAQCPAEPPPRALMAEETRALHDGIDAQAQRTGVAYLHPQEPTVQLDLLGSAQVVRWQDAKAAFLFAGDGAWSALPHLYARYGTTITEQLRQEIARLEAAKCVLLTDSGMQATALVFDVLMTPGAHAVIMRQVYNKTNSYLAWVARRLGGEVTIVDDGDAQALASAIRPTTRLVYAETFTNPRLRAQDLDALPAVVAAARAQAPGLKLIIDSTIATPWGIDRPLLELGVDVVVASGTKALGGQDADLSGYIATNDAELGNGLMDLAAMRGGILDWRRARAILAGLPEAERRHVRRCENAVKVAAFLAKHPRVSEVLHPSRPDHPDGPAIAKHYKLTGGLLSFRVAGADEEQTRHIGDVIAMSGIWRYALSFDGLASKINHQKTVSEYFTPDPVMRRNGFDRLLRLAVGVESADDLIACLNWALHRAGEVSPEQVAAWQDARGRALGLRNS